MKIYKLLLLPLLILVFNTGVIAQKNLEEWVSKNEKNEDLEVVYINNKSHKTKVDEKKTIVITFKNDEDLQTSLLEAYEKDKDNAYRLSEIRKNGVVLPDYCRFLENTTETRFLFEFKGNTTKVTMQKIFDFKEWSLGG